MKTVAKENLNQLKDLLVNISSEAYTEKPDVLSGATIGQHIRHILEFYMLLISGSYTGMISYDKRERDIRIESDPGIAILVIERLLADIETLDESYPVEFEADYSVSGNTGNLIISTIGRELAYCIEHSIHHQALIKAGLIVLGLQALTDEYFGVAYSTIRYRNNVCAQ
jgi:uncharacterized damage-inducible protein DinB